MILEFGTQKAKWLSKNYNSDLEILTSFLNDKIPQKSQVKLISQICSLNP